MVIPPMCEVKSYETIKAEIVAIYQMFVPTYIQNESDTIMPVLEAFSYREMMLRNLFNAQITGSFWQTATGENLDFIAQFFGIERLIVSIATDTMEQVNEDDEALRKRIKLAFEGQTTAGSANSYKIHALNSDGRIDDVNVFSSNPGEVNVIIYSLSGVDSAMLSNVILALNADTVRPITDKVVVEPAAIVNYDVVAAIQLADYADSTTTLSEANTRLHDRLLAVKIGESVTISSIISALSVEGVVDVTVVSPVSNITVARDQVANFTSIAVSNA